MSQLEKSKPRVEPTAKRVCRCTRVPKLLSETHTTGFSRARIYTSLEKEFFAVANPRERGTVFLLDIQACNEVVRTFLKGATKSPEDQEVIDTINKLVKYIDEKPHLSSFDVLSKEGKLKELERCLILCIQLSFRAAKEIDKYKYPELEGEATHPEEPKQVESANEPGRFQELSVSSNTKELGRFQELSVSSNAKLFTTS